MFSTYIWPNNFVPSQYQQYSYYTPSMVNLPYSNIAQTIIPLNSQISTSETKQKLPKIIHIKKIIKKENNYIERKNENKLFQRNKRL
jgi:predicted HAD superfamily phosphohydrolase